MHSSKSSKFNPMLIAIAVVSVSFSGCGLVDDIKDGVEAFVAKIEVSADQVKNLVKNSGRVQQIIAARLQTSQVQTSQESVAQAPNMSTAPLYRSEASASAETSQATDLDANVACSKVKGKAESEGGRIETFKNCTNTNGQIKYKLTINENSKKFDMTFLEYEEGVDNHATFLGIDGTNTWQVTLSDTVVNVITNEQTTIRFYNNETDTAPVEVIASGTITYTFDIFKDELIIQGSGSYTQGSSTKTLSYSNVVYKFGPRGCSRGPSSGKVRFADPGENKFFELTIVACAEGTAISADGTSENWGAVKLEEFFSDILVTLESIKGALNNVYRKEVYGDLKTKCEKDTSGDALCDEITTLCKPPLVDADGNPDPNGEPDQNWVAPEECGYYLGFANLPPEFQGEWCAIATQSWDGKNWTDCLSIDPQGNYTHVSKSETASVCSDGWEEWGWMEFKPDTGKMFVHSWDECDGTEYVQEILIRNEQRASVETLIIEGNDNGEVFKLEMQRAPFPWGLNACVGTENSCGYNIDCNMYPTDPSCGGTTACTDDMAEPNDGSASSHFIGDLGDSMMTAGPTSANFMGAQLLNADWYHVWLGDNAYTDPSLNELQVSTTDGGLFIEVWQTGGVIASGYGNVVVPAPANPSGERYDFVVRDPSNTDSGMCRPYDLNVNWQAGTGASCQDDTWEFNDSQIDASYLGVMSDVNYYQNHYPLTLAGNDDWYSVYIQDASDHTFAVDVMDGEISIEIYDDTGIQSSGWGYAQTNVYSPGTYYVHVINNGYSCYGYSLNLDYYWNNVTAP